MWHVLSCLVVVGWCWLLVDAGCWLMVAVVLLVLAGLLVVDSRMVFVQPAQPLGFTKFNAAGMIEIVNSPEAHNETESGAAVG